MAHHLLTDVGISRPNNEDFVVADETLGVYILCDGVGGNNAGEYASATAANYVLESLKKNLSLIQDVKKDPGLKNRHDLKQLLQKTINEASTKIHTEASQDIKKLGMATTLDVLLIAKKYAFIAHVGDSRVYLLRQGKVHPMTDDHTVGMEFVKTGQSTLEQAKKSPYWNVLSRAVGAQPFVKADVIEMEIAESDYFLMMSDGVSDVMSSEELAKISDKSEPASITKKLIEAAKAKKSKDNLSAIAVHIDERTEVTLNIGVVRKIEVISQVSLFRFCTYKDLTLLLNRFLLQRYKDGQTICEEKSPSDAIYVILSGEVEVDQAGVDLVHRKPGEVLGEMGVLEALPRSAALLAKEETELLVLPRDQLIALLKEDSRLAVKLLWALCQEQSKRLRVVTQNWVVSQTTPDDKQTNQPFIPLIELPE